jgi:hypothetical protein
VLKRLNRLNGWWRLWVVASILWCGFVLIAIQSASYDTSMVGRVSGVRMGYFGASPTAQAMAEALYRDRCFGDVYIDPANFDLDTARGRPSVFNVYCTTIWDRLGFWGGVLLGMASAPVLILLGGITGRWIYRGFRPVA